MNLTPKKMTKKTPTCFRRITMKAAALMPLVLFAGVSTAYAGNHCSNKLVNPTTAVGEVSGLPGEAPYVTPTLRISLIPHDDGTLNGVILVDSKDGGYAPIEGGSAQGRSFDFQVPYLQRYRFQGKVLCDGKVTGTWETESGANTQGTWSATIGPWDETKQFDEATGKRRF
jgi:hypothetical protein